MNRLYFSVLLFLTACTTYTSQDLIGSWKAEENGIPLALQFSDSLALIYDGGVDEIFVYAYKTKGNKLEMEFRDGFIPNTENYTVLIAEKQGPTMTLEYGDESRLTFTRFSKIKPEIHLGQLLYYNHKYRRQLSEIQVPYRDPPDFNEIIGFDCGLDGVLTGPVVIVQGLIKDKKFNELESLAMNGNLAESVLASIALLALEEQNSWKVSAAENKISQLKNSTRKVQMCISDHTLGSIEVNTLFDSSTYYGEMVQKWVIQTTQ
jgi:hypothetical protein